MIISDGEILAMHDDRSPYFYLPGGRVMHGETAEDVDNLHYHELCIYFLMNIEDTDLLTRSKQFASNEGHRTHNFEWLEFDRLQDEYFYPLFLKKDIFNLPSEFTIRTEFE